MRNLTLILAILSAILLTTGNNASALPTTLDMYDYNNTVEQLLLAPGYQYRIDFSYSIDAIDAIDADPVPEEVADSYDTFYYGLFTESFIVFFDRYPVDIYGPVSLTIFPTYTLPYPVNEDLYLLFLVADGTPSTESTVHLQYEVTQLDAAPIPEPSTILLFAAGMFGVYGVCRRRG